MTKEEKPASKPGDALRKALESQIPKNRIPIPPTFGTLVQMEPPVGNRPGRYRDLGNALKLEVWKRQQALRKQLRLAAEQGLKDPGTVDPQITAALEEEEPDAPSD